MRRSQRRRKSLGLGKTERQEFRPAMEQLEKRELLVASGLGVQEANRLVMSSREFLDMTDYQSSDVNPSFIRAARRGRTMEFTPIIVGGSAIESPADAPSNAIDPNTPPGGTFGGVVHIKIQVPNYPAPIQPVPPDPEDPSDPGDPGDPSNTINAEFSCTGTMISADFVLTASHCFDTYDETDPVFVSESGEFKLNAGNGVLDPDVVAEVQLNDGDPAGNGVFSSTHMVSTITMHPSFAGFASNLNDDIALLKLTTPVPEDTPIYAIDDPCSTRDEICVDASQRMTMVGYGLTGSGDTGLIINPSDPDFRSPEVKRQRQNIMDFFGKDDETFLDEVAPGIFFETAGDGPRELYVFDFDGPTGSGSFGGPSLGNDVEGNVAPGDSGGPSFLMDPSGILLQNADGQPIIGGINTFNGAFGFGQDPGFFGGRSGGNLIGPYADWINSIVGADVELSSSTSVEATPSGNTKVTYEVTATNLGPNDAFDVDIDRTEFNIPAGATVSVEPAADFSADTWSVGQLAAAASETLTIEIEFDPTTLAVGDPFDIDFALANIDGIDLDDSNDSVDDAVSLEVPVAATVSGSAWIVDPYELTVGLNGTLSWSNLNTFDITYAGPLAAAPPVQVLGPTDGAPEITATLQSFDGLTAEYTVPAFAEGYFKIVASGEEIDFAVKPGDFNGNSIVDRVDYIAVLRSYLPGEFRGPAPTAVDFNGSGTVDQFDRIILLRKYNTDLSAYTPPTVPPPSAPASLLSAALVDAVWSSDGDDDEDA